MRNTNPTKKQGVNSGVHKVYTMLLIYKVKSGKSTDSDRGKNNLRIK